MNHSSILLIAGLLAITAGHAQCPERPAIMSRMLELKSSGTLLILQRDELLQHIQSLKRCPQSNDTVLVHLLQRTGAVYYLLGDFSHAAQYTTEGIETLRRLTPVYNNDALVVRMYHYLNIFYDSLHLKSRQIQAIDS